MYPSWARGGRPLVALGAAALLAGSLPACSVTPHHDRRWVASELRARSAGGPQLGPAAASPAQLPPGVTLTGGLTEDAAVAVAVWQSPLLQAELAQLGLARADLYDAGLLPNPTFSLFFPLGPKQLEFTLAWPLDVVWQRPRRLKAAHLEAERVARNLVQLGLDLVRDARAAHVDLWLAEELTRLRAQAEQIWQRVAELTEARFKAGEISEAEATAARVEALTAGALAQRSRREIRIAEQRLRMVLGLISSPQPLTAAAPVAVDREPISSVTELERTALAARPDLRASELAIEAAAARLGWERTRIFSAIAYLDANGAQGQNPFNIGPGLQVTLPIFNQNQGGIARARAEMQRASFRYLAQRQQILLEVRQAHTQWQQAHEVLTRWQGEVLPRLEKNAGVATGAFERGAENYLFVLEANRRLVDARLREAELRGELRRARAQLDRAIGRRIHASR